MHSILMVWFGGRPSLQQRFTSQEPILNKHYSVPCKRDALYQFSFSSYKRNRKGLFLRDDFGLFRPEQNKQQRMHGMGSFFRKAIFHQMTKRTNERTSKASDIGASLRLCGLVVPIKSNALARTEDSPDLVWKK